MKKIMVTGYLYIEICFNTASKVDLLKQEYYRQISDCTVYLTMTTTCSVL